MENLENASFVFSLIHFITGTILTLLNQFILKEDDFIEKIKLLKLNIIKSVSKKLEEIINQALDFGTATQDDAGETLDLKVTYTNYLINSSKQCCMFDRMNKYYNLFHSIIFYSIISGIIMSILSYFDIWVNIPGKVHTHSGVNYTIRFGIDLHYKYKLIFSF
jgi:hypothetical protein